MPDDNPQGTVTPTDSAPDSAKEDWTALAGNLLEDPPETDKGEEEVADDGSEEAEEELPEEGDSDDEDEADTEASDRPRDEKGRFISEDSLVRKPDGTVVSVRDLLQGDLRQADYTRKTQEVAEQRRAAEERARAVEQLETQLAQRLDDIQQRLEVYQPPTPDPTIIHSDPLGYMQQKAAYDQWVADWHNVQQQRQEQQQRISQEQRQTYEQHLRQERERLLEAIPDFKDETKFGAFRNDAAKFGTEVYGFTPEELSITDHRYIRVLRDAIAYRKLQAQKPKAQDKAKGKPPVTPGRRQDTKSNDARALQRDIQTLTSTRGHGPEGDAAWERALKRSGHI